MGYALPPLHPLLSPAGRRLLANERAAQLRVAQAVLKLPDGYTGEAALKAADALALQVSIQIARNPREYLAQSTTTGSRSITFVGTTPLHPLAVLVVEQLAEENADEEDAGTSRPITSFR